MFEKDPLASRSQAGGIGRRRFVQGMTAAGTIAGVGSGLLPGKALAASAHAQMPVLSGTRFDLTIALLRVNITGRPAIATAINGSIPGPVLRWRQGDTVVLNVTNRLGVPTSIHWHGIRSPANMDGVPGLSFPGIMPGETFTYRIPVRQSGTYWYHSHSAFQEQTGVYGPIVIEPRAGYPAAFDRSYVVMLTDWTDTDPEEVVSNLKFQSDYYNFHQRTVGTFLADARDHGLRATVADRLMWGRMRMSPTDILDVTGHTYTYLVNGQPPGANWTALFRPGERVRLRFINGSSMSIFDVRIPGLAMSVVEADGNSVHPVSVDEFRVSVAETYDVIVRPREDRAYTIFAQAEDRTGYARGTLATRAGMAGPVPPMDPRPIRTMTDMGMGGMDMGPMAAMTMGPRSEARMAPDVPPGGMKMDMRGGSMTPSGTGQAIGGMDMGGMDMSGMDMGAGGGMAGMRMPMDHGTMAAGSAKHPSHAVGHASSLSPDMTGHSMPGVAMARAPMLDMEREPTGQAALKRRMQGSPEVDNVAMTPTERLDDPGDGLSGNGRRVLTYADLRALQPGDDPRPPSREVILHLTGNMDRYIWGFDGKKFSEAEPIRLRLGERVRLTLVNDTMMDHPIHLHGLWSELENGHGAYRPYKHTINVKPGERLSYLVTADTPGHWAYHCHLLYHMEMGMFRTVVVA